MKTSMIRQMTLPIWAVGLNSFREALRNRVLAAMIVLPLMLIGLISLLGEMSLHNEVRVAKNVGYFFTMSFSIIVSVYATVSLVHTELERKTIYTLLSKPIERWQFLTGKFFGVCTISCCSILLFSTCSVVIILLRGGAVSPTVIMAFLLIIACCWISVALTVLFSTFTNSFLSAVFACGMILAGFWYDQISLAIQHFNSDYLLISYFLVGTQKVIPNLHSLNLAKELTYDMPLSADYVFYAILYSVTYALGAMIIAITVFKRRTFT